MTTIPVLKKHFSGSKIIKKKRDLKEDQRPLQFYIFEIWSSTVCSKHPGLACLSGSAHEMDPPAVPSMRWMGVRRFGALARVRAAADRAVFSVSNETSNKTDGSGLKKYITFRARL